MNSLLLAAVLVAAPARADWSDVSKWLGEMKAALAESAVRRHQKRVRGAIAVAAVRGDKQSVEDPNKPYWKGTAASKQERDERDERAELTKAVQLAIDGKPEEALKALDAFEAAHPKSAMLDDCRQAREKLKAAAPKEEPKPLNPDAPAMPGAVSAKADPAAAKAAPQADEAKK